MDYKEKVNKVLEKIYNKNYKINFSEDLSSKIKTWPELNEHWNSLFFHGLEQNGHGGYFPFLKEIILEIKPNHVVELGNREGMSTLAIIDGLRTNNHGLLTTVDVVDDLMFLPPCAKEFKNVNFVFGDCLNPQTVAHVKKNGPIDILFLDTIHTCEQLKSEWNLYRDLLSDNALVLVDDVNLNDKKNAFDCITQEKIIDVGLHVTGFGVIFYKKDVRTDEEFWNQEFGEK